TTRPETVIVLSVGSFGLDVAGGSLPDDATGGFSAAGQARTVRPVPRAHRASSRAVASLYLFDSMVRVAPSARESAFAERPVTGASAPSRVAASTTGPTSRGASAARLVP